MPVKICTIATVPDSLTNAWLQHLRDFDTAHADCHFEVMAEAPDMSMQDIIEAITINPHLGFVDFMKRKP